MRAYHAEMAQENPQMPSIFIPDVCMLAHFGPKQKEVYMEAILRHHCWILDFFHAKLAGEPAPKSSSLWLIGEKETQVFKESNSSTVTDMTD